MHCLPLYHLRLSKQVDRNFITYEEAEQIVRFASSNTIEALSGEDRTALFGVIVSSNMHVFCSEL